ncbi:hypothetical protein [Chitinophaga pinensis]|uniref:hypothetical protein n=1 Tax=Chitinophaga pinensis TaxID=79329 RepID=UPI00396587C9
MQTPLHPQHASSANKSNGATLVDFGKETFGFIRLHGVQGTGNVTLTMAKAKKRH